METFRAKTTQYMRPNGRKKEITFSLPESVKAKYDLMLNSGCRLEAEVLQTDEVSVTIADVETDHYIEIIPNGPEVQQALVKMLTEFDPATITIEPLSKPTALDVAAAVADLFPEHGTGHCVKADHFGDGHLHDSADDWPYDVDGVKYCGRCHCCLP